MQRSIMLLLLFVFFSWIIVSINGCTSPLYEKKTINNSRSHLKEITDKDRELWNLVIRPYLRDSLWSTRDIYDASHHLMVPLHSAFSFVELQWQKEFSAHFGRFLSDYPDGMKAGVKQRLDRLHYFYLVSRYLALSYHIAEDSELKKKLYSIALREIEGIWNDDPAWQWGRSPFPGGIRERVLWKLQTSDVPISYYRAIIDEELFTFAIAADLLVSSSLNQQKPSKILLDVLAVARQVFESEVIWTEDGKWLFQPGVWVDGPGHAYAGQAEKKKGIIKSPVLNVSWDSSHSHRFPLWLSSLQNAYSLGSEDNIFYHRLLDGLAEQVNQNVLVPPDEKFSAWRMKNYMDGRNGLYRWREEDGFGYGPYELSGTFLIGWWSFLDSQKVSNAYFDISSQFPLPESIITFYVGPNTSRPRHPFVTLPNQYKNGFIELIVRLASKSPSSLGDTR